MSPSEELKRLLGSIWGSIWGHHLFLPEEEPETAPQEKCCQHGSMCPHPASSSISELPTPYGAFVKNFKIPTRRGKTERDTKRPEHITSYTWASGQVSKLILPGVPPVWKDPSVIVSPMNSPGISTLWNNPTVPLRLESEYTSRLNLCSSTNSTEQWGWRALFTALEKDLPRFHMNTIAVASNQQCLYLLLMFVLNVDKQARPPTTKEAGWRIYADVVNGTMFLTSRPRDVFLKTQQDHLKNLGTSFPGENHVCHHRVIQHSMGRFRFLLDFEVEASLSHNSSATHNTAEDVDTVVDNTQATSKDRRILFIASSSGKTGPLKVRDLARLWLTNTNNVVLGHLDETVLSFAEKDVETEVRKWENKNAEKLSRFGELLKDIRAEVLKAGPCYVISIEKGNETEIKIYRRNVDGLAFSLRLEAERQARGKRDLPEEDPKLRQWLWRCAKMLWRPIVVVLILIVAWTVLHCATQTEVNNHQLGESYFVQKDLHEKAKDLTTTPDAGSQTMFTYPAVKAFEDRFNNMISKSEPTLGVGASEAELHSAIKTGVYSTVSQPELSSDTELHRIVGDPEPIVDSGLKGLVSGGRSDKGVVREK